MTPPSGPSAPTGETPGSFGGSFLTPDYQLYWSASLVTHMAFQMQTVVLGWHVLERTDSALWVGMVGGAYGIPMLLLAPLVGVLADQSRRQRLIAIALTIAAGAGGFIALLTALHLDAPWHMVAITLIIGSGFTLYAPARLALLPNLLPRWALLRASTIEYSSTRVAGFFGPASAGVLVDLIGTWQTLLVLVGFFLVGVCLFLHTGRNVPNPSPVVDGGFRPLHGVRDAWCYLRTDPPLFALFLLGMIVVPLGMAYMKLLPVFARDVFGTGASALGVMVGVVSLGTAFSGFAIAIIGDRFRKGRAVLIAAISYGATLMALGFNRNFLLAMVLLLVLGLLAGVFLTLTNVLLQSRAQDHVRGRVMALYGMVWGSVPLFTLVAGAFAEQIGVALTIAATGALCAAACLAMALRGSALRFL